MRADRLDQALAVADAALRDEQAGRIASAEAGYRKALAIDPGVRGAEEGIARLAASRSAELVGNETGLAVYLKANEGTGSQLADATGHGNVGVIRNIYGAGSGVVAGRIDHAGQRDFYSFTLDAAKQLYFDSLTQNASMNWTLTGQSWRCHRRSTPPLATSGSRLYLFPAPLADGPLAGQQ